MKKINLYKIVSFSYKLRIFLAYVLPSLSLKFGSVPIWISLKFSKKKKAKKKEKRISLYQQRGWTWWLKEVQPQKFWVSVHFKSASCERGGFEFHYTSCLLHVNVVVKSYLIFEANRGFFLEGKGLFWRMEQLACVSTTISLSIYNN